MATNGYKKSTRSMNIINFSGIMNLTSPAFSSDTLSAK